MRYRNFRRKKKLDLFEIMVLIGIFITIMWVDSEYTHFIVPPTNSPNVTYPSTTWPKPGTPIALQDLNPKTLQPSREPSTIGIVTRTEPLTYKDIKPIIIGASTGLFGFMIVFAFSKYKAIRSMVIHGKSTNKKPKLDEPIEIKDVVIKHE
jgi:hypothetical protein